MTTIIRALLVAALGAALVLVGLPAQAAPSSGTREGELGGSFDNGRFARVDVRYEYSAGKRGVRRDLYRLGDRDSALDYYTTFDNLNGAKEGALRVEHCPRCGDTHIDLIYPVQNFGWYSSDAGKWRTSRDVKVELALRLWGGGTDTVTWRINLPRG